MYSASRPSFFVSIRNAISCEMRRILIPSAIKNFLDGGEVLAAPLLWGGAAGGGGQPCGLAAASTWGRLPKAGGPTKYHRAGFRSSLHRSGIRRGEAVVFADEMRLGLLGQVRRVCGRRGEKLRRRVELRYEWVYWVLGVDPIRGLGEAGARGGDSSGAQDVEGDRGERRGMGPCGLSQGEGGGGSISRPIRLSSILRSGYLRRFGGG